MERLTTARYLLKQVQSRRLELLAVRPRLNPEQLKEYRQTEKAIKELESFIDAPQEGQLYALTGGLNTPSIARGDTWAQSQVNKDQFLKDHIEIIDYR